MRNTTIQIRIDNFEGPLDLLIHMIEKKKLKINEINISDIIDDYLHYRNEQKNFNLKIKVEFLTMATELLEIKAYSILNQKKKEEKIENLEKRMIEYKFFKEISILFSEYENEYNISYRRIGNKRIESSLVEYDISRLTLENLVISFKNLINNEKNTEKLILNLGEEYSTDDALDEIYESLEMEKNLAFGKLLKKKFTKSRIVSLFLCILELFKNGEINIISSENEFYIQRTYN